MISDRTIQKYKRHIIYQLTKICKSKETAEDAFQEACVKCWKSKKEYNEGGLYSAAKNSLIDIMRREYRRRDVRVNKSMDGLLFVPQNEISLEEKQENELWEKRFDNVLSNFKYLSDTQLIAIKGRLNRNSFNQIADENEKKLSTVVAAYHYGVKRLQELN